MRGAPPRLPGPLLVLPWCTLSPRFSLTLPLLECNSAVQVPPGTTTSLCLLDRELQVRPVAAHCSAPHASVRSLDLPVGSRENFSTIKPTAFLDLTRVGLCWNYQSTLASSPRNRGSLSLSSSPLWCSSRVPHLERAHTQATREPVKTCSQIQQGSGRA